MSDYYRVQLGTIYLTDTGLVGGAPCRVTVSGLAELLIEEDGPVIKPMTGRPKKFLAPSGIGADIQLKPLVVTSTVLTSLKSLINTSNAAESLIVVNLTGVPGNLSLGCRPAKGSLNYSGNFTNSRIYDLEINLTVDTIYVV